MAKKQFLIIKKIGEISLVPESSNPDAEIVITKSAKTVRDEPLSDDVEINKALAPLVAVLKEAGARKTAEVHLRKMLTGFSALRDTLDDIGDDDSLTPVRKAKIVDALNNFEGVLKSSAPSVVVSKSVVDAMSMITADDNAHEIAKEIAMDIEKIKKALETAEENVTKMKGDLAARDAEIVVLKGKLIALDPDAKDEDIYKGLPDAVVKKMKALEASDAASKAAFAKMADDKGTDELVAFCKQAGVPDFAKVGAALYRIGAGKARSASGEGDKAVPGDFEIVKAGIAALGKQKGAVLRVVGKDGDFAKTGKVEQAEIEGESAFEKLSAAAVEIRKAAGGKITSEAAFAQAMEADPKLYQQYMREQHPNLGAAAGG